MKKITGLFLTVLFFYSNFLFAQIPDVSDQYLMPDVSDQYLIPDVSDQYLMIESLMNPALSPLTYALGPGDKISLNLWGNINVNYTIGVARDGTIFIPRKSMRATASQFPIAGVSAVPVVETVPALGEIRVVGLTVAELKKVIEERVKNYFRGVNVRITLIGLRSFPIPILGSVARAGVYSITPLYRLSHIIKRVGGISQTGSYRNIIIKKPDGSSHIYDLYEFFYKGNMEQNPYIKAGDIVMIPQAIMSVKITGRVLRTGNYELKEGDRIKDLIEFAGGIQKRGSLIRTIKIYNIKNPDDVFEVDPYKLLIENDSISNIELKTGDVVTIPMEPFTITIIGEVMQGGTFEYEPGADFNYYLGITGGYAERANVGDIRITRWDGTQLKWRRGVGIKPGDTIVIGRSEFKGWRDYLEVTLNAANLVFIIWTVSTYK